MTTLSFEALDARAEAHAAVPTIMFRLRVAAAEGATVHAVALRCQLRIEPQRRRYGPAEEQRLEELFGATPRWGDTVRPFLWTHASTTIPGFTATTEVDLPVTCSYDFEVAGAKYLHALGDGEIPLLLLFTGTVFRAGPSGFSAEPIGWDQEASYRLPVSVWRGMMDLYFPRGGWLRLASETLDGLQRFKASRALASWDQALEELLGYAEGVRR